MSDPLSSLASVITVAGGATESIVVILSILRQFRNAPAEVHQWLIMLESLRSTLSSLQQFGQNLDPGYRFSLHFRQRLLSCVAQLQVCTNEIARINANLTKTSPEGKQKWDHKARGSWERAKWAIVGDYKMKRVMKMIHLYHFEFVIELLKVSIVVERSQPLPSSTPGASNHGPQHRQQRLKAAEHQPMLNTQRPSRTASDLTCHVFNGSEIVSVLDPPLRFSSTVTENNCLDTKPGDAVPVHWCHEAVKPLVMFYWNISSCRLIVGAGPVIQVRSCRSRKAQRKRCPQVGFGVNLSLYLPPYFRKRLQMSFFNVQMMLMTRTRTTLHWSVGFPNIVPPDAEIFKSTRAGLTDSVKCLLSTRKASAKDTTFFGTNLLHSASNSGNMELVRLLIQEGAEVNAHDEDGESPLHGAMARSNNYDVVRTLIENGADMSNRAIDGKTPLHAIFSDTIRHVLMRDEWLDIMEPDSDAMSITHFLAWSSRSTLEIFQRGQSYDGSDLFSADFSGRTCLHFATSRGNLGVLSYLVSQASVEDIEKKDSQGRTPLHYAGESSRALEVINMLVRKESNVNAVDNTGRTILHLAARWNNLEAVKKLTAMVGGRSLLLPDQDGRLPSREVCQTRAPSLYKYLSDRESSSGSNTEPSYPTRLQRRQSSGKDGPKISFVLDLVGILVLCLMALLGAPD